MALSKFFKKRTSNKSTKSDVFDENALLKLIQIYEDKSPKYTASNFKQLQRSSTPNKCKDLRFSPSNDTPVDHAVVEFPFNATLYDHGYIATKRIRESSQGQIIEVRSMKNKSQRFVIKKVDKTLCANKVTKEDADGIRMMVEKDIIKEALLLFHCTVANKAPIACIPQFIDFFHDDFYYYLVMESGGNITLEEWYQTAFEYLRNHTLEIGHYHDMVQRIFWQLSVLIYWLHHDLNIAHLGIKMEHIMIENGDFIQAADGKMTINRNIKIKLCDFSLSEIFQSVCLGHCGQSVMRDFDSKKHCFSDYLTYCAPKIFAVETYDAQKADIWSMAVVLYRLTFGEYPYEYQSVELDSKFSAICRNELDANVQENNLSKYCSESMLSLICRMFNYSESMRPDALQIIQSEWLDYYWQKDKVMITKMSISQRDRLNSDFQRKWMRSFPYYHHSP